MSALPVADLADSPLLALLADSALAVERLAARERHRLAGSTLSSRRALLAIELRLKLEEQALLPHFRAIGLPALDALLRELLGEAALGELALPSNRLLWASIERTATLHFDAVAQLTLLALADSRFDADQAWHEAEDYRARWRGEIADSGDVEDEEADPVGQPPR
jgi:hypothetical protein